jgi:hypothetical protein
VRLVRHSFVAFALVLLSGLSFAQDCWCCRRFNNSYCTACTGISRAYHPIEAAPGSKWCTVCLGFCQSAQRVQATPDPHDASQRPMVIAIEQRWLYEIAQINPEAAVLGYVLAARSKTALGLPPESGNGGSTTKNTARAAMAVISADGSAANLSQELFEPYEDPTHATRWSWNLVKRAGGTGTLQLRHRVVSTNDETEIGTPYPDIELSVVRRRADGAGYWTVTGWRPVQSR